MRVLKEIGVVAKQFGIRMTAASDENCEAVTKTVIRKEGFEAWPMKSEPFAFLVTKVRTQPNQLKIVKGSEALAESVKPLPNYPIFAEGYEAFVQKCEPFCQINKVLQKV